MGNVIVKAYCAADAMYSGALFDKSTCCNSKLQALHNICNELEAVWKSIATVGMDSSVFDLV